MLNNKTKYNFPIGFYDDLHKDSSINFQMNRLYSWSNDTSMLYEMREVSPYINNYDEYMDKFLKLGQKL
ncbi:hypothetical protein [Clostridium sp. OS1-26]|uniref:hypothetical protein n=1 Tax=Clostridium sp. OS1-26 TaxID=3070681 RepID=UPI0027DFD706|nr:hypothetical protein [Clostridium sp. OS1-26]WML32582.1 hypothetical protein RCG18_14490 [Clostridium sp. OS1-26]